MSLKATGSVLQALVAFEVFYASCVALTWICYMQRRPAAAGLSPAEAHV